MRVSCSAMCLCETFGKLQLILWHPFVLKDMPLSGGDNKVPRLSAETAIVANVFAAVVVVIVVVTLSTR